MFCAQTSRGAERAHGMTCPSSARPARSRTRAARA
jgi:hypothetical protein